MGGQKMHQTTVRFGADLWRTLEEECSGLGVSVAQFVREAALARLMYVAGRRGDSDYDRVLERAGATDLPHEAEEDVEPEMSALDETLERDQTVASTLDRSAAEMSETSALWAQGRQARRRARELREESARRQRRS